MASTSAVATKQVKRRVRNHEADVQMASNVPVIDGLATPTSGQRSMESKPWSCISISSESYFFVPFACSIQIYSTSTLKVASTLSSIPTQSKPSTSSATHPDHHTQLVTSILLNPNNPLQLYSASLDGTIKIWDWLDGILLKTIDFLLPIWHMCAHSNFPDTLFLHADVSKTPERLISREQGNDTKASSRAFKVTFKPLGSAVAQALDSVPIGKPIHRITALAISPNGLWLVATSGMKAHIASTSRPQEGWSKFTSTHRLTCLAFHPTQGYFATGDEEGVVRLWHCLNDDQLSFKKLGSEKKAATSLFHWHPHAVQSLAFTPNGSYLLSGGLASVLVMWQIETGHKGFVPRVGAPINGISVVETSERGQEFLLGLADGDFVIVSANILSVRSRSGLKLRLLSPSKQPPILAIHPQRNWIAMSSSHPASLQVYDPYISSLVFELDVAPSNRVAATNEDLILTPCTIIHAAFSSQDGRWLATVDLREATVDSSANITLKIWSWIKEGGKGSYILNTKIDRPHGKSMVTSIQFGPLGASGDSMLATAGEDGTVRLWGVKKIMEARTNQSIEEIWVQRASISYRSQVPRSVAFSSDHSVIAVTYSHCVALFNGSSHAFLQVITNVGSLSRLSSVTFLGRVSRYLAICGSSGEDVLIWDLISSRVVVYIDTTESVEDANGTQPQLSPRILQRPDGAAFAVVCDKFTQIWDILQLRPLSEPVFLPIHVQQIAQLHSSNKQPAFTLAAIARDGRLALVGDDLALPVHEGAMERTLSKSGSTRLSLFEDVFGRSAFRDLEDQVEADASKVGIDSSDFTAGIDLRLLDGPAYLLPPIGTLFSSLMDGILKRSKDEVTSDVPFVESEAEVMEIDEVDALLDEPTDVEAISSTRTVDQAEMDMIMQIFQEHCAVPVPSSSTNGHAHGASRHSSVSLSTKASSIVINGHTNGSYGHHPSPSPAPSDISHSRKSQKTLSKRKAQNDISMKAPEPPKVKTPVRSVVLNGGSCSDTPSPPPMVGQKRKAPTRKGAKRGTGAGGLTSRKMMYTNSSPDPEGEDDFAALRPRVQRLIDHAFDRAVKAAPNRAATDTQKPSSNKRRIAPFEDPDVPASIDDDGGGFLPPEEEGGGFLPSDDDNDPSGGFMVGENDETVSREDSHTQTSIPPGPTHIPISLIPRALQILDLPQDPDVLSIFQQAASGWGGQHIDQEDGVSLKDWRAVCAVLLADPRDTGMERPSQSSSAPFSDEEMDAEQDEDEDNDEDENDAERAESPAEGNDGDYAESDEGGYSVAEDDDGDEDEYRVDGRPSKRGSVARKTRSSKRSDRRSASASPADQGPIQLTARQRNECLKAFALFFPDFADDKANLIKQRILIRDVARIAKLLKERLATEEILEMLEAFSTSPDKSMGLTDFEQMMMVTGLA
ncbi:hypothetical protein FRB96_000372 [Tulasnella sp. 330]|nr:hypothetical protein FRB96_000372 [Tulasnella sp. 330]